MSKSFTSIFNDGSISKNEELLNIRLKRLYLYLLITIVVLCIFSISINLTLPIRRPIFDVVPVLLIIIGFVLYRLYQSRQILVGYVAWVLIITLLILWGTLYFGPDVGIQYYFAFFFLDPTLYQIGRKYTGYILAFLVFCGMIITLSYYDNIIAGRSLELPTIRKIRFYSWFFFVILLSLHLLYFILISRLYYNFFSRSDRELRSRKNRTANILFNIPALIKLRTFDLELLFSNQHGLKTNESIKKLTGNPILDDLIMNHQKRISFKHQENVDGKEVTSKKHFIPITAENVILEFVEELTELTVGQKNSEAYKNRFLSIIYECPIPICLYMESKRILLNPALESLCGVKSESDTTWKEIFHSDEESLHKEFFPDLISKDIKAVTLRRRVIKPNMEYQWVEEKLIGLKEVIDHPLWLVVSFIAPIQPKEITSEEVDFDKAQPTSYAHLEYGFDGLLVYNIYDHSLILINNGLKKLLGIPEDILPDKFYPNEYLPEFQPTGQLSSLLISDLLRRSRKKGNYTITIVVKDELQELKTVELSSVHPNKAKPEEFIFLFRLSENLDSDDEESRQYEKEDQMTESSTVASKSIKGIEPTSYLIYMTQKNKVLEEVLKELQKLNAEKGISKRRLKQLISTVKSSIDSQEGWNQFQKYFEEEHTGFFISLQKTYPGLSQNELLHCALLKMKLSIKDVARFLNISKKTVETNRYRIKKKIDPEGREGRLTTLLDKIN
ncbi:MAG: hypothetical protein HKN67_07365 [Saprospiraceae bacterium]|nr:hypothetical protein [Saprospiraceae bacterium]